MSRPALLTKEEWAKEHDHLARWLERLATEVRRGEWGNVQIDESFIRPMRHTCEIWMSEGPGEHNTPGHVQLGPANRSTAGQPVTKRRENPGNTDES